MGSTLSFADCALTVEGKEYRGRVFVAVSGGKLQVVNLVKLEDYVKGVAGLEMPPTWPAAALEAQAVAARSYALATLGDTAVEGQDNVSKLLWANWHRDLGELAMDVVGKPSMTLTDGELDDVGLPKT